MIDKLMNYRWKPVSSFNNKVPTPRWGHASVVINNEFVVFGGYAGVYRSIQTHFIKKIYGYIILSLRSGQKFKQLVMLQAVVQIVH
jgi:hypothetical protein